MSITKESVAQAIVKANSIFSLLTDGDKYHLVNKVTNECMYTIDDYSIYMTKCGKWQEDSIEFLNSNLWKTVDQVVSYFLDEHFGYYGYWKQGGQATVIYRGLCGKSNSSKLEYYAHTDVGTIHMEYIHDDSMWIATSKEYPNLYYQSIYETNALGKLKKVLELKEVEGLQNIELAKVHYLNFVHKKYCYDFPLWAVNMLLESNYSCNQEAYQDGAIHKIAFAHQELLDGYLDHNPF